MSAIQKYGRFFLVSVVLFGALVMVAHAQNTDPGRLGNPLNFDSIPTFLAAALGALVDIGIPIVVLFLVVAGFQFIAAQGNPGKLEKAKMNLLYVLIGALFILGAALISKLIAGTVSQLVTGKQSVIDILIDRA